MKKKLVLSVLSGALTVSMLAACGETPAEEEAPMEETPIEQQEPAEGEAPAEEPAEEPVEEEENQG